MVPAVAAARPLDHRSCPEGALLALAASLLAPGSAAGQEGPVFPAETRLVVLHATVRNPRGELVTNLDRGAFTVYENGKAQPIAFFRRDDIPVSLGLLIDNSGSMRKLRTRVEATGLACVRASNPQDEVFVLNFADKAHIDVAFTSDVHALEAGIARPDSIGGTAMHDAIEMGTQYLYEHSRRDRKVLLVITDGFDNASAASIDQIRTLAEQREIVIYAIGLLDEEEASKAKSARHELDQLAEWTGGAAYYPVGQEGLDEAALAIARQIRSQYTIGYAPPEQSLDGSYRKLRVVAKGAEKLSVRTRSGYRAVPLAQGTLPGR
jgi:Ca-activated chloride channel family protein